MYNFECLQNLKRIICKESFDREILVWGASYKSDEIVKLLKEWGKDIEGFIDTNESIQTYYGMRVYRTDVLKEKKWFIFVALRANYEEVINYFAENGYEEFVDYWYPGHLIELDGTINYEDLYGNRILTKNNIPIRVKVREGGKIEINSERLNSTIVIASEGRSTVIIGRGVNVGKDVIISSTNGTISIGNHTRIDSDIKFRTSSGGQIVIGEKTSIQRNCMLVASFDSKIILGEDCMLSYYISLRAGNSHNMIDLETGEHFDDNNARDVVLGKHVWIGMGSTIMNGVKIGSGSMIGANSFVCKKEFGNNCCAGGNPAKILREKIAWMREGKSIIKNIDEYEDCIFNV